jgi:hypothetical protein
MFELMWVRRRGEKLEIFTPPENERPFQREETDLLTKTLWKRASQRVNPRENAD